MPTSASSRAAPSGARPHLVRPPSRSSRVFRQAVAHSATVRGKRFVIVASQFNPSITRSLIRGATSVLQGAGVPSRNVRLLWVPGAFELPVVALRAAECRPRPHAIVALGALIRGQTPQYEVIAHAVAQGLSQASVATGIPITFGVIVATSIAQAKARSGGSAGNRGAEAAMAALVVLRLFNDLKPSREGQSIVHSR